MKANLHSLTVLIGLSLCACARAQSPNETHNAEVKLIVPAALATDARKAFEPASPGPVAEVVCFYDTADMRLQKAGVILRARRKDGKKGEATVKLTYADAASAAADKSTAVEVEEDWVDAVKPRFSRSVDGAKKLADGQSNLLPTGALKAKDAFDDAQRTLVEQRVPGLKWEDVKCFGPVSARIWKNVPLPGFATSGMTVEDWSLDKTDGKPREDILEVSVKGEGLSATQLAAFIANFFHAAEQQQLGTPTGESKTKRVLGFFAPGK